MFSFDQSTYGPVIADLFAENGLCQLGPGQPNQRYRPILSSITPSDVVSGSHSDEMASCCLSGLWLWHNFLTESHSISQNLTCREGSYWHGIMHRREPDYSNAKYWYRRVGDHPIFPALLECAQQTVGECSVGQLETRLTEATEWDPYLFVDLCEHVADGTADEDFCRRVATLEWQLLFDYCYRMATEE